MYACATGRQTYDYYSFLSTFTMGTRGNYIFRRNGKYYVFYNHFDSYFSGLGKLIVAEIRSWTAADFELVKTLLDGFKTDMISTDGGDGFKGLMEALKDPYAFDLIDIGETTTPAFDIEYTYTLDLDENLFIVSWVDENNRPTQRYRLTEIPEDWITLTGRDD